MKVILDLGLFKIGFSQFIFIDASFGNYGTDMLIIPHFLTQKAFDFKSHSPINYLYFGYCFVLLLYILDMMLHFFFFFLFLIAVYSLLFMVKGMKIFSE